MKKFLDKARHNQFLYGFMRSIYKKTIGVHLLKKIFAKNVGFYTGKHRLKMLGDVEANQVISKKIRSGKPFMLARYGSTEFRNMFNKNDINLLCFYSGFFPDDKKYLKQFRKVYMQASKSIDIFGIWNYLNHFIRAKRLIGQLPNIEHLVSLASFGGNYHEWLKALKGKRILVIHPYKSTIEDQYKNVKKLGILPKLGGLEVIRSVQTIAGNKDKRFDTWFDALEFMKKEISKKDFDIAIIGCGAYGLPLASHVKSIGKQALHLGGGVQLLFGIKGKRWEKGNKYEKGNAVEFGKYWVSPMKQDMPENYDKIEGGCYC